MNSEPNPEACEETVLVNPHRGPTAGTFFKELFKGCLEGRFIELRKIRADWLDGPEAKGKGVASEWFVCLDDFLQALSGQKKGWHYYFGVNPRDRKQGRKDAVTVVTCFHADCDFKTRKKAEWKLLLRNFEFSPTVVVESGNGFHSYWLLEKAIELSPEDKNTFTRLQKALQTFLGADHTHDLPRLLRVPGSKNWKQELPKECRITYADYSRRYTLDQFKGSQFFQKYQESQPKIQKASRIEGSITQNRNITLTSLAGTMRQRGISPEAIEAALLKENELKCDPPLSIGEVKGIAESVSRYEAGTADPVPPDLPRTWPVMKHEAFHGLAGQFIEVVGPHTEADPVALLAQLLVGFGNLIGRTAFFNVEADQHFLNENLVLVGETAKGRKGTSWGHVRKLLVNIDSSWEARIHSGLSSGEGLIWAIRDPVEELKPVKKKDGNAQEYENVITDQGVDDKRLLVIEAEFSSALRVLQRDGNTLSPIIRNAWDGIRLETLVKNSKNKASNPHVSLIGHVTREELNTYLDRVEAGNGFGNRFLWLCTRRSRSLPEGGNLEPVQLRAVTKCLEEAESFARGIGEIRRSDQARGLWREVYTDLSEGKPGLLGAMIARAEAHVMRLACIYAVLDQSTLIRAEHLTAALALWEYCEESARYIFSDSLGDPVADQIMQAIRNSTDGLTRTEIRDLFSRNKSKPRIDSALNVLLTRNLIFSEKLESGGRPTEVYKSITRHKRYKRQEKE